MRGEGITIDPYKYRPSGDYLIRKTCESCGMVYNVYALSNTPLDGDRCPACQVKQPADSRPEAAAETKRTVRDEVGTVIAFTQEAADALGVERFKETPAHIVVTEAEQTAVGMEQCRHRARTAFDARFNSQVSGEDRKTWLWMVGKIPAHVLDNMIELMSVFAAVERQDERRKFGTAVIDVVRSWCPSDEENIVKAIRKLMEAQHGK